MNQNQKMKIQLEFNGFQYSAELNKSIDLSIPIKDGHENPNCYWSDPIQFEVIRADGFVGSIAEGGVVNHKKIHLTPHGNGTHTECFGHISADQNATINKCLLNSHFIAEVISVKPEKSENGDLIITEEEIKTKIKTQKGLEAIIIRTLPNNPEKQNKKYSGTNPPYFSPEACTLLVELGIKHLLVDLPSIDKEVDGGRLAAHKNFWNIGGKVRKECTITELIYVNSQVEDGLYLLNLQIISLELDASPSKPVVYKLNSL